MRASVARTEQSKTRRQLAFLMLAAMACVAVLLAGLMTAGGEISPPQTISNGHLSLIALVAAAGFLAGLIIWRMTVTARREARLARAENQHLRRSLAAADAIVRAEPQVLIFWEQGQAVRIVSHTLNGIPGLPAEQTEILRFGHWLLPASAENLKTGLDALFATGRSFNIILHTVAHGTLEAEGRTAGGRAVLRLKDVAGFKAEIARVNDQQEGLRQDIRASRALLDALPMPVWLRDRDDRLTWVNHAYVAAVDASSEREVLERQIELLESRQRRSAAKTIAKGESFRTRAHLVVNGERKAHDIVVLPTENATAGAAIDVAAIESAQDELERQIVAYDRTLDRVETAVAIFSSDQHLVFFNEAYLRLWQLETEWLETRPTDSAVLDRLREQGKLPSVVNYRDWKARVLACYRTGTPFEDVWHLSDGRVLNVIGEQRPDGGVTYLFADQTARIELESRYNALIDVQRETLDSLKEGVAVFGTDGRLKLHNAAFSSVWNLQPRSLSNLPHIETVIELMRPAHDDDDVWDLLRHAVTALLDERQSFDGQMVRADQSVIDYAVLPLPDGASLLTFADVTDAKRAEKALVERNEALVAADRLKTQFISHISYELRTPLNSIIGFTDMLASPIFGDLNDKQREYLADIMSSSKTLLAIINDILDLTTIDAGGMELALAPVGVRSIIDAAILGIRERAVRGRLTIDIAVADDVTEVMADATRLRQILYNLLSNAVGFSKANGVIQLTCWRENGMVVFQIEDFGVGIPRGMQERVFDRFESRSQGSKHRGAGLGLSIAKSLVELHGGTIEMDSVEQRGTRVIIRIPERPLPLTDSLQEGRPQQPASPAGPALAIRREAS